MSDFSSAIGAALSMVATLDADLIEIVLLSLQISLSAVAIASIIALPLGALIALQSFPGRRAVVILLNALMGLPPVVVGLMVYLLLVGPTYFLMNNIVEAIGTYAAGVWLQGFRTYTFFEQDTTQWFGAWTLNYMVWWLAWAPFVGVFIARISRGRTIKEFLIGVLLAPTVFSIFWFGIFGGLALYDDGSKGDPVASDGIYERDAWIPAGTRSMR